MHTPSPSPLARPPPDLTPAPALLKALAHVTEVDLAKGLGRRRLAQVIRDTSFRAPSHRTAWLAAGLLLVAGAVALLLALR